jgi:hypothetical protein
MFREQASGTDSEHSKVLCDNASTQKLVTTNLYNYASFVISDLKLNVVQGRYIEEARKLQGPNVD